MSVIICFAYVYQSAEFEGIFFLVLAFFASIALTGFSFRFLLKSNLPSSGFEVTSKNMPELFKILDDIATQLDAPGFSKVYLDESLNASVHRLHRYCGLGKTENSLRIGVPLMDSLPTHSLKGVLAHEYGHLLRKQGFWDGAHLRSRIAEQMAKATHDNAFYNLIYRYYLPSLDSIIYENIQQEEFFADKTAANLYGSEAVAYSLFLFHLLSDCVSKKMETEFFHRAYLEESPPKKILLEIQKFISQVPDRDYLDIVSDKLMKQTGKAFHSHPSMEQRLQALGFDLKNAKELLLNSALELHEQSSSSLELFKHDREEILAALERDYRNDLLPLWRLNHTQAKVAKDEANRIPQGMESVEVDWLRLVAEIWYTNSPDKLDAMTHFVEQNPSHAWAHYLLGIELLNNSNDDCIYHMEEALRYDISLADAIYPFLYNYMEDWGRLEEADIFMKRYGQFQKEIKAATKERSEIRINDKIQAAQLDAYIIKIIIE
ncbi:MAG: M48 family metallopeptidase, partial [Lentisphaeria bacterium]|nr:M48 family metallopeptidase [Lentisphaeria bacterium]